MHFYSYNVHFNCNLIGSRISLKTFTNSHLFQIAREKSCDYFLIMYIGKFEIVERITQSGKNCAIEDASLIWKQKIWLALTKPYCLLANHNPEFRRVICTGITPFALCYTWTALLTANQNGVFFFIKKFFSLKWIHLPFKLILPKKFWIWLNPRFSTARSSRARGVARPRFRESGSSKAMTSTQEPNRPALSHFPLIFARRSKCHPLRSQRWLLIQMTPI